MSIDYKVFGIPGQDNAIYCNINTGQDVFHILFDCGYCGLHNLGRAILQDINMLFFSHAHMDHIAGFDTLFRHLYSRSWPLHIFGPQGITQVIKSRLTGFSWNLIDKSPGEIIVHERVEDKIISSKFLCREAFKKKHSLGVKQDSGTIFENSHFTVNAVTLNHNLECSAYCLREKDSTNININKLRKKKLKPGAWCKVLKNPDIINDEVISVNCQSFMVGDLRAELLELKKGKRLVYATDFVMNKESQEKLLSIALKADILFVESMYLDKDVKLAKRNYHLTVSEAANFAVKAKVNELIIFHVSDRYDRYALAKMINKAQEIFPNSKFPVHWKTGDNL